MKSGRLLRLVTPPDEALSVKENEKEESDAIGHHYSDIDHHFSKSVRFSPKVPLVPDKANKVAEAKDYKSNQDIAFLLVKECEIVTH